MTDRLPARRTCEQKLFRTSNVRLLLLAVLALPPLSTWAQTTPQFSTFDAFQRQLRETAPIFALPQNLKEVPAWRDKAAARLRELLGVDSSKPVPLKPRVRAYGQRDGYRIEHVIFTSEKYVDVPGLLLIPDGVSARNPAPAVLCIHGGVPGGKDELAGETSNPLAAQGLKQFQDDYARQFAQEGFIAFAIDLRNVGERANHFDPDYYDLNNTFTANRVLAANAIFFGQTWYGLNLFDSIRALDYLMTRPEVRKDAIAAAGFSSGGELTAWLAALDRRVKVGAMEGNWHSWRRLLARDLRSSEDGRNGTPFHRLTSIEFLLPPGFLRDLDVNISVATAAPMPLIICLEVQSWSFRNLDEAKADTEPIRRAFDGFGAAENLRIEYVWGEHMWRKDIILPWFSERLRKIAGHR